MVSFKTFLEQTWNGGMPNIFAPTIFDPSQMKGSRHRRNIILDVPINRKHARTVPKYKQADPNIIRQIETLKLSSFVKMPIGIPDIKKIAKKFKINSIPQNGSTVKLKNLGIGITWSSKDNQFYLHKL